MFQVHPMPGFPGLTVKTIDLSQHAQCITDCVKEVTPLLECKPPMGSMYGKMCYQQRSVGFFGPSLDVPGYRYSRQVAKTQLMSSEMRKLLGIVNSIFPDADYNGILVNLYPGNGQLWSDGTRCNGKSNIAFHGDSEAGLFPSNVVAISWGASRAFKIRPAAKKDGKDQTPIWSHDTKSNELLCMHGVDFQKLLQHGIPASTRVRDTRVSFTFRRHITPT